MLRFLQARNPAWLGRPFFARFDARATWLDQLEPAFGAREFFFEPELGAMRAEPHAALGWRRGSLERRRLRIFDGGSEAA